MDKERAQYTEEQAKAGVMTYFFQRESNGEIFGTSMEDAWNIRARRDRTLKFVGASNGALMRKMLRDKAEEIGALNRAIQIGIEAYRKFNDERVDAIRIADPAARAAKQKELDEAIARVKSEQKLFMQQLEDINQVAFKAELEVAKKNGGKIPDLSIVGNEGGVSQFKKNG